MSGARSAWAWCAVMVACAATAPPALAQDDTDAQVWVQVLAVGQLGEEWRTHVEVQPRFVTDASELGLTIVRTAIGHRVAPGVTAWLGHAWVPRTTGLGVRHEQRLWQQVPVRWGVFAYDEAMVTLDRTPRGPARGFDRNRLAAGLVRRFSATVSTDIGYIWEHSVTPDGRRNDHVMVAVLNLSVPR